MGLEEWKDQFKKCQLKEQFNPKTKEKNNDDSDSDSDNNEQKKKNKITKRRDEVLKLLKDSPSASEVLVCVEFPERQTPDDKDHHVDKKNNVYTQPDSNLKALIINHKNQKLLGFTDQVKSYRKKKKTKKKKINKKR